MGRSKILFTAAAFLSAMFIFVNLSYALEISLEPAAGDFQVFGQSRFYVYAVDADALISMGIEISYDPQILEVVLSEKNDAADDPENVWRMTIIKEDGTNYSFNSPLVEWDNGVGTVTLIGAHSYENLQTGASTVGLNGKVLLGWIDFRAKADGQTEINVDLARYHPLHPAESHANFVSLTSGADEPLNLGILAEVHAIRDSDDDGLGDTYEENEAETDPMQADTDGDGILDNNEDLDFDGVSNAEEYSRGTHPREPDIFLSVGLNLIGYPVSVPIGYSSFDFLADLGTGDEVDKIQRYDGNTGVFETATYDAGVAVGDDFDILSGEGYLVYMKEAKAVSFSGKIMTTGMPLRPGFNIVSVPCMPPEFSSSELITHTEVNNRIVSMQKYDRNSGSFITTAYRDGQIFGIPFKVVNGEAYLVSANGNMTLPPLLTAPTVAITSHEDGDTINGSTIDIFGSVDDDTAIVTVNGIYATVSAGTFWAAAVPLAEGPNAITATAVSANNLSNQHRITVTSVLGE